MLVPNSPLCIRFSQSPCHVPRNVSTEFRPHRFSGGWLAQSGRNPRRRRGHTLPRRSKSESSIRRRGDERIARQVPLLIGAALRQGDGGKYLSCRLWNAGIVPSKISTIARLIFGFSIAPD